jgi:hypothetical protein
MQVCRTVLHLHRYELPVNEVTRDTILSIAKGKVLLEDFPIGWRILPSDGKAKPLIQADQGLCFMQ